MAVVTAAEAWVKIDLASDLAASPHLSMYIHVGSSSAHRREKFVKLARTYPISGGPASDIFSCYGARNRPTFRTGLGSSRTVTQIRAQEHNYGTVIGPVFEMNMRLCNR